MRIIRIKVRFLIALVLLSLTTMAGANEVDSANTVSRLSPREFTAIPAQVRSALIELGCTIPQVTYFSKGKSNVISGNFAKQGQMDYAALCSRNGVSHIQVIWGGKTRCKSELETREDSIYFQGVGSEKMEYSRVLDVTSRRAIANLSLADDGSKLSAPYHEAIQDAFAEKGSTIFYCEKGKWHKLEGAD